MHDIGAAVCPRNLYTIHPDSLFRHKVQEDFGSARFLDLLTAAADVDRRPVGSSRSRRQRGRQRPRT
jgi:hypothetical protein